MKWFYAQGQQQIGPVEDPEFERLIGIGVIRPETLVWSEGMANWQNLASVRRPVAAPPPPPVNIPAEAEPAAVSYPQDPQPSQQSYHSQQSFQASAQTAWQPAAPYGGAPGYAMQGGMAGVRYAGFWIRFLARVLDGVILFFASLIIRLTLGLGFGMGMMRPRLFGPSMLMVMGPGALVGLVIAVAYEAYFVSTRGATPGKMALHLKIVQADGSPVPVGLAVGRYFAMWISYVILLIGFIMAAFDSEKRSLHDRICNTRVIHTD